MIVLLPQGVCWKGFPGVVKLTVGLPMLTAPPCDQ